MVDPEAIPGTVRARQACALNGMSVRYRILDTDNTRGKCEVANLPNGLFFLEVSRNQRTRGQPTENM